MPERRSTAVVTLVEYRSIRSIRVSAATVQVEYAPARFRRVSAVVVQVEFHFPILPDDQRFGPAVQVI